MSSPPEYPAPDVENTCFADTNLNLVILDALLSQGDIALGKYEQLAAHVLGHEVDFEEDGWDLIQPVLDYLQRYPLTQSALDRVETVCFDGGLEIYVYPFFHWGGSSGDFDIH